MNRDQLALEICTGMWGRELAEVYRRNGDVRWHDALRTADHLMPLLGWQELWPSQIVGWALFIILAVWAIAR